MLCTLLLRTCSCEKEVGVGWSKARLFHDAGEKESNGMDLVGVRRQVVDMVSYSVDNVQLYIEDGEAEAEARDGR